MLMLRTLLLCFVIALSLSACGNKGPLVLPDQATQKDKDKDKPVTPPPGPGTTSPPDATRH
jgi:predicted small lipoprotein YifL